MQPTLTSLLSRHAAAAMLAQLQLGELVGDSAWSADLEQGTLRFAQGPAHSIQLLGTESYVDGSWLWAWGNQANFPQSVVSASLRLREYGEHHGLQEFTTRKLPLAQVDGFRIASIASQLLGASAFYRGPYGGPEPEGAAFFLLTDFPPRQAMNRSPMRLLQAVSAAFSTWPLDHKTVVLGLAADLQLSVKELAGSIELVASGGEVLVFEFDAQGRIGRMQTQVRGTP